MSLLDQLTDCVGAGHVLADKHSLQPLLTDNRGKFHGSVLCAVCPANTEEVSQVMRICANHSALVFVQGGNTGNAAAATPVTSPEDAQRSVLVLLNRMNRIIGIDRYNDTVTVEAGCILENLQNAAQEEGKLFCVSLAAQGSCTVGGILACNAGGVHVLNYGNTRDQCLGLEVVLADGRILNMMKGLRKDNTGYDLKDMFIGSEGTLGIITKAVLKICDAPHSRTVLIAAHEDISCVEKTFVSLSSALSGSLTAFELMHRDTVAMVRRMMPDVVAKFTLDAPWYTLIECTHQNERLAQSEHETLLEVMEGLMEDGTVGDAVISESRAQCEELWKIRESIPSAHKKAGGNVKHDISVPRSRLARFVTETNALLAEQFPWIAPSVFGHFGDGNLHYNMGSHGNPKTCFEHEEAIHETVYRQVALFGGSVAAEHGVGRLKASLLESVKEKAELDLMRSLKNVFDPEGRLNPGAVLANTKVRSEK